MYLKLENISKSYGDTKALSDVSFEINGNKIVGLVGRNGAGKTTLIKIIMNIMRPDTGEVKFEHENFQNNIGFLPEERGLYVNSTVKEQLLLIANLNGMPKKQGLENIKYYLEKLELGQHLNTTIKKLSKGNKQKIQLISAIIHNPEIIILDEPFSGLDPVNALIFREIILECKRQKKLIIFSSHRLDDIEELCDYVLFLKNGEIFIQGDIKQIKEKYTPDQEYILDVDKDITEILRQQEIDFYLTNRNEYNICGELGFDVQRLISTLVKQEIKILTFYKKQVSLKEVFVKELGE